MRPDYLVRGVAENAIKTRELPAIWVNSDKTRNCAYATVVENEAVRDGYELSISWMGPGTHIEEHYLFYGKDERLLVTALLPPKKNEDYENFRKQVEASFRMAVNLVKEMDR